MEGYKCPICCSKHSDEYDAEECLRDCWEDQCHYVVQSCEMYKCKYCDKEHNRSFQVEECEKKHEKYKDRYYENYIREENFAKLKEASNNKEQVKLI